MGDNTRTSIINMRLSLLLLYLVTNISALSSKNELTCTICVDIVTEIDDWITSDKTEEQILDFFNQICLAVDELFPGLGETCTNFLQNNGPGIINSIVHENLNLMEVCTMLTVCP